MVFWDWLRRQRRSGSRNVAPNRFRKGVLCMEPLEERALLSAWADFTPDYLLDKGNSPTVQLTQTSNELLCGVVQTPGMWVDEAVWDGQGFSKLQLPESGVSEELGAPELPVIRQWLAVPENAEIVVTVIDVPKMVAAETLGLSHPVVPAQPSVEKTASDVSSEFYYDSSIYATDAFLSEPVCVTEAGMKDGVRYVSLEISPVSYNPVQDVFAVYDTLTFTLSLTESGLPVSAKGEELTPVPAGSVATKSSSSRFLVVAHKDFVGTQAMADYVAHKTALGWTVDLVSTTEAGATSTEIQQYIQGRYADSQTRPEAVLLVGDTDRIPSFTGSGSRYPSTDLYYACMDSGDDWIPDLPLGRFSVADAQQLADVVSKTIAYETSPGGEWTSKATFIATSDTGFYDVAEGTHDWVIDTYMDPLGYASDRLYAISNDATTDDLKQAFDDGRVLGVYSGHGGEHSWVGPFFSESDVHEIENLDAHPFVASFACVTGQYTLDECFAETWFREPNGAINVFASSVNSLWTEDDILERRLFDAIYNEGIAAFGEATLRAKEMYLAHFGPTQQTRGYFEQYNLLGDPTVELLGLGFSLASDPVLPSAYLNEPYEFAFRTSGGGTVSSWSLAGGSLPPGLSFDSTEGRITGTPTETGTWSFNIDVIDSEGTLAQGTFRLDVVSPLVVTTPVELPPGFVGIPYSVSLSAEGGVEPYAWSASTAGDYIENASTSGYLGGGTAMAWQGDDTSWSLDLPWDFTFYGNAYDSVAVCSNGFLDFTSTEVGYSNSDAALKDAVRIAPLWDDLRTDASGGEVYITETDDYVAIRWKGETYSGAYPVDFEAVLYQDGAIRFNYNQTHNGLSPTIGISAGNNEDYLLASVNTQTIIAEGTTLDFAYESLLPPGLTFDSATATIEGIPTDGGDFIAQVSIADNSNPAQALTTSFSLQVSEFPPLNVSIPETATEGDGLLASQGVVSLALAVATDLEVTLASSDTSEVVLLQSNVIIPAGQLTSPFDLLIQDDAILDGSREVVVSASATDYVDGTAVLTVHDDETAVISLSLSGEAVEGDGTLADAGLVTVSTAPDEDVVVYLTSLDTTELACPDFVTLPAGQTSVSFDVAIVDDQEIDGSITAQISAEVANWNSVVDSLVVGDNDAVLMVTLPERLWEGAGPAAGLGVVELGGRSSQNVSVTLFSSHPDSVGVPVEVVVEAGQLSAEFPLDVLDDTLLDGEQTVTIGGSANGLSSGSAAVIVSDDDVDHFAFGPIDDPQTAAEPFSLTITAKNIDGETIQPFDGTTQLTVAGDDGELPFEFIAKEASNYEPVPQDQFGDFLSQEKDTALGVYHDYADVTSFLGSYAAEHSSICHLVSLGQSVQGRELWAIKISDNPLLQEDEPEFKYVSTMHGDERISLEMTLYLIDEILTGYGTDAAITELVDETEIWIVPLMNPDGLEAGTRYNANGVDLNRAFPDGAVSDIGTVYADPLVDVAGFQPEVAAVMQWGAASSASLSANLHSGALLVNYPYDNDGLGSVDSPSPDDALFEVLAETYSIHNSPMWNSTDFTHGISNGAEWYSMDGGMQDWNYRYLSCNEVTIELSDVKTPAESLIDDFWNDNRDSMLAYMEAVHLGVRGMVTDATTGAPIYATISVAGNAHDVYSDPDVGDYHRLLLPGTYDLTISAPGYSTQTITGVVVDETMTKRVDVELTSLGEGVAFSNGVWTGQIAINAIDSNARVQVSEGTNVFSESNAFQVLSGPVSSLAFDPLSDTQYSGVPFDVTLMAVDDNGFAGSGYSGTFSLQAIAGGSFVSVSPTEGTFENGVWSGQVTLSDVGEGVFLVATCDAMTTQSEPFEMVLLPPLDLQMSSETTEGSGIVSGTVVLPRAAVGDLVVTIESNDLTELVPIQPTLTIPSGQLSAVVQFAVADDVGLDGTQVAVVTVSANDYLADTAFVSVHDNETTVISLSTPTNVREEDGPTFKQGTISIPVAVADDVTVALNASNGGQLNVPASVVIPAGQTSVTFDFGAVDDSCIDGDQPVELTASVENWTSATQEILVTDDETRDLAITLPSLIWEGESVLANEGFVSISGTLPYDLTLAVEASKDGILGLPQTVTILAGQTNAPLAAEAIDDLEANGNRAVTVTVSTLGFTTDSTQTTIADDEVDIFVFAPISQTQTAGVPFGVEVEARNIDGMPIAVFDGSCDLDVLGGGCRTDHRIYTENVKRFRGGEMDW